LGQSVSLAPPSKDSRETIVRMRGYTGSVSDQSEELRQRETSAQGTQNCKENLDCTRTLL